MRLRTALAALAFVSVPLSGLPSAVSAAPLQHAVLAGGCFWGMEEVFEHVKGVTHVTAGFSGGAAKTAHYEMVSAGDTGHAESVDITFDPARVSYAQLLNVFFTVAIDPTQKDRQGPDSGTQYRSVVWYANTAQRDAARTAIAALHENVATEVQPLHGFYAAEDYHQHYAALHPDDSYIVINDAPKVAALQQKYPTIYAPKGV